MIHSSVGGRVATVLTAGAAALALGACGSSSGGTHHTGSASPSAHSSSGSGGQSADAATVAAVKNAYTKFFAPDTPENVSLSLLQDGQAFKAVVEEQAKGSLAQNSSASVSSVTLQSPNVAAVVFSILVKGQPVLKDQHGLAVKENGTWKVAGQTFCGLLTLQGTPPPACHQPEATSLPK